MYYHLMDWCIIRTTIPIPATLGTVDKFVLASWSTEFNANAEVLRAPGKETWQPFKPRALILQERISLKNLSVAGLISWIENADPFVYRGYPLDQIIDHLL